MGPCANVPMDPWGCQLDLDERPYTLVCLQMLWTCLVPYDALVSYCSGVTRILLWWQLVCVCVSFVDACQEHAWCHRPLAEGPHPLPTRLFHTCPRGAR